MCQVFGWSIDDVLGMTCPQFKCVASRLNELISTQTRDEVFLGVAAAIGNNSVRKSLFESCGGYFKKNDEEAREYTEEELAVAQRRLNAIIAARQGETGSGSDE